MTATGALHDAVDGAQGAEHGALHVAPRDGGYCHLSFGERSGSEYSGQRQWMPVGSGLYAYSSGFA